ncbi:MAG: hypothetical protein LBT05_16055 [Planctomycetaceae bacterium]|jgi:membrane-bound ClpP family serine protease|nr:hypothetical protein [Planctomycetaceae bacterium]
MLFQVFLFCAILGGIVLVIQTVLTLFGLGGNSDMDFDWEVNVDADGGIDHAHNSDFHFFRIISLRTLVAGITFFGLAGCGTYAGTKNNLISSLAAIVAGTIAVILVYRLYRWIDSYRFSGNVTVETLVGAVGTVYVRIPPEGKGAGKVLVTQQNRTMEYEAISNNPKELQSGTQIAVVKILSPSVVEVTEVH